MSLERINLYNPVQEQLNVLRDMRRYHQEMQDADIVASFNVQFADSLEVVESESTQFVQSHKVSKSRYDKKAMKRKGSTKRFKDRSRKCASEGHMYSVYCHGKRQSRTHSVNIRINGTQSYAESAQDYTEGEVNQLFSMDSWNYPMKQFLSKMDNYDWEHLPNGIGFYVNWDLINPFISADWAIDQFAMTATLKKGKDIVTAEKAKEEYLDFRKTYEVYQKYAEKVRALREEMKTELATERK